MKTQSLLILVFLLTGKLLAQNVQMEGARVTIQDQAKVGNIITGTGNDVKITQHITQNVLPKSQEFTYLQAEVESLRQILADKNKALNEAISADNSSLEAYIRRDRDERAAEYENARQRLNRFKEDVIRLAKTFDKIPVISERLREARALFQNGNFSAADALLQRTQMGQETDGLLRKKKDLQKELSAVDSLLEIKSVEWLIKAEITKTRRELTHWLDSTRHYFERSLACDRGGENQFQYALFLQHHKLLEDAIKQYRGAREVFWAKGDSLDVLFVQSNLAVIYQEKNELAKAEKTYLALIGDRKNIGDTLSQYHYFDLAVLKNNLGNVYRAQSKLVQAEAVYTEALLIRKKLAEKGPLTYQADLAITLENLGILYSQLRQNEKAEPLFLQAIEIRQALSQNDPNTYRAALATSQSNLGTLYRKQKKLNKAEALYLECLSIRQELSKDNPLAYEGDLAAIEHNLGTLGIAQQKFKEAQHFLSTALERRRRLAEGAPVVYEPLLATTQQSLGYLFVQLGKFMEAEQAFQEVLTIREQLSLKNPVAYQVDLGTILISQGHLFYQMQKWEEAEATYLRALQVWEPLAAKEPALYSAEVAKVANALGAVYDHGVRDKIKAEIWYRKALDTRRLLAEKETEKYALEVGQSAVVLASFLLENRDSVAAIVLFREALQISDRYTDQPLAKKISSLVIKSIGIEQADPDLANWERKSQVLARAVQNEKEEGDRIEPQRELLKHWQAAHQIHSDNPRITKRLATTYGHLARLHLFVEDFQTAENHAKKGLGLTPELCDAQAPLAVALLFQNRFQEALPLLQACRDKRKSKFLSWGASLQFDLRKLESKGITHPQLAEAKTILAGE